MKTAVPARKCRKRVNQTYPPTRRDPAKPTPAVRVPAAKTTLL